MTTTRAISLERVRPAIAGGKRPRAVKGGLA